MSHFKRMFVVVLCLLSMHESRAELSLAEAERLAIQSSPNLSHHRTNVSAAAERVVYAPRLPDPQLIFGAVNVPTDSFRLGDDDTTMIAVGVRQQFLQGRTGELRRQQAEKGLAKEEALLELERRNALRQVRQTWLDLYYLNQSLNVLRDSRQLYQDQLSAAEGRYRAAADTQLGVLRARQARARLSEREQETRALIARAQAQLARWIGDVAFAPLPKALPELPPFTKEFDAIRHPDQLAVQADVESARIEENLTRQEYRPGVMLDLTYGVRQQRADMVTAMMVVDLPIFTGKRQDRRVAEKEAAALSASYAAEDKRREIESMYKTMQAEYSTLSERVKIYAEQILPDTQRETRAVASTFARDRAELIDTRLKEIETSLELVRLRVELAKRHADLLYLLGDEST